MSEFFASIAPSAAAPATAPVTPERGPIRIAPPAEAEPPHRSRRLVIVVVLVLLAAVSLGLWLYRTRRTATSSAAAVRTAVAERRDLVSAVRVTGTVEATQSYVVAAASMTGGG